MVDNPGKDLQINIPEQIKIGVSSNIVSVTSTSNGEVILDFIFAHPLDKKDNISQGTVVSRIILPAKVAQDLNTVLSSHVGKPKKE